MDRYKTICQEQNDNIALVDSSDSFRRLLAMIPMEWLTVYEEYFNEFILNPTSIDPSESKRIEKDLTRTFSLFSQDPACTSIFHSDRMIEKRSPPPIRILGYSFISSFRITEFIKADPSILQNVNNQTMMYIEHLKIVLTAVCKDSGYCQGMNFLAAKLLLIENDPKFAFTMLSYILRQKHLLILFDPHNSCLMDYMNIFHKRLRRHNRLVYRHLKLINFPPLCFTIEWFTTCFIVSSPGKLSTLVLELIVVGFDDIMMDIGLALLDTIQEQVLSLNLDGMQSGFKALLNAVDPITVVNRAMLIREETMREKRYALDGVNILKMMYELFLENAADPVKQQYIRDQHPYRRLRCNSWHTQSMMLSSVAAECDDASPAEYVSSGDDEQSARKVFPSKLFCTLQHILPPVACTSTIPITDPVTTAAAAAVLCSSSRKKRRTARRRQRSAKRTAVTMCSQRYLSKVDYRRYLDVHFGECDFAIEFLDAHKQRGRQRTNSSDSVTLLSWTESDNHDFSDGKSFTEGVDDRQYGTGQGIAGTTLLSSQASQVYNQVNHTITATSPLSNPLRAAPSDHPLDIATGLPVKKAKPLRGNDRHRVCSIHWNTAILSITEDWFFPYLPGN